MTVPNVPPLDNISPDVKLERLQFDFTGSWQPDLHPLKIISGNFSDVQNVRYNKNSIQACNGYTKINVTTALSAYPKGRSGFQLRSPHEQSSYIFTQQYDDTLASSLIYLHKVLPPGTGDFESTAFHSNASGSSICSFTEAPDNNIVLANGVETLIYGGNEGQLASFILTDGISNLTLTNPIVYTDLLRNTLSDSGNVVAVTSSNKYLIGSTRPIDGFKVYISTENLSTSTLVVKEWTGAAWAEVTSLVDGTASGGISHAQTGFVSFQSTLSTSKPAYLQECLFYWYQVYISAGSASIYHVTVSMPKQPLKDLWDGVNRTCIACQVYKSSVFEDYTPEVYDVSSIIYPIAAKFAGVTSSDYVILAFADRMTAVKFGFIAYLINKADAVLSVSYWNGSAWTSVGNVYDGTIDSGGTKSMARNGTVYWDAPSEELEHKKNDFGVYGYMYKFSWNATLTDDTGVGDYKQGCYVDTIYGIPAVKDMPAYSFSFNYKNRLFLAGDVAGNEGHRLDYSAKDTPDCFNGNDASSTNKRIYVGKNSLNIVAAANIFNRFGANIYNSELLLKPTETYLLDGDKPENFTISTISENIGTQAPRTLCTAEVAFEVTRDAIRNVAMWISNSGPVIFDAAVLVPIKGIELYFDKTKDTCVNYDAMSVAHAWFDPNHYEWNVCLPVGVGQTTCNVWLNLDMVEKKWSKYNIGTQYIPQAAFKVIDENGNIYFYGLIDSGHMVRLDNGQYWNDTEQVDGFITTNDILPTSNMFDITTIRNIKLLFEGNGTYDIEYTRSDISINGAGIESGDLRVYGELIEDPTCTASYWDGENFICKTLEENVVGLPTNWAEVDGDVQIKGVLYEDWEMEIVTVAGNFITAGFLVGMAVMTSDVNNPGPFVVTSITATKMTFSAGKGVTFLSGTSITLYSTYIRVDYYANGSNTPVPISFNKFELLDSFTKFMFSGNLTALSHKFKFSFYATSAGSNVKPLAWAIEYLVEREEV